MISKIEVWGDGILRGVVLDPETRVFRLKEASCVALSSRARNPSRESCAFRHDKLKGPRCNGAGDPCHAEGEAALIRVQRRQRYRLRLASRRSRYPATRSITRIPAPKRFCENMR